MTLKISWDLARSAGIVSFKGLKVLIVGPETSSVPSL